MSPSPDSPVIDHVVADALDDDRPVAIAVHGKLHRIFTHFARVAQIDIGDARQDGPRRTRRPPAHPGGTQNRPRRRQAPAVAAPASAGEPQGGDAVRPRPRQRARLTSTRRAAQTRGRHRIKDSPVETRTIPVSGALKTLNIYFSDRLPDVRTADRSIPFGRDNRAIALRPASECRPPRQDVSDRRWPSAAMPRESLHRRPGFAPCTQSAPA